MNDIMIVGIAGGTGSGKTTITDRLVEKFGGNVSVVHHDNYYKAHHNMTYEERCLLNYDHPDSFDTDMMIEHLQLLKQGKSIECPIYDYTIHDRSDQTVTIEPTRVLIVERILNYADPRVCDQIAVQRLVDTDADVRILRRIQRDVQERGRSLESVINQYLATVKPMHEQFVEPSKRRADVIIPEGGRNLVALEMVVQRVRAHIDHV